MTQQFRFSAEKLAALPIPPDAPATYYDKDIPQLGVRIQPTGNAVFFVLKKICGKTYRKTLGDCKHLKLDAARKHAHKLLGDVADWLAGDRGKPNPMTRPLDDGRLTFQVAFEMYLKAPLKGEGKRFVNREKADARRQYLFDHCFTQIAGRPIDEFTTTVVCAHHEKLQKKFGPVMANRGHEVLRATFNHLIKKGLWTSINPAIGATRAPKVDRAVILEDDQLKPFFDALDAEKNRDLAEFLALLLACGARKSNLYAAEWSEISLPMGTWTIPASKYKNGKTTTIKLSREAVTLFKMRKERPELKKRREKGCPWVFPSKADSSSGHVTDYKNQFERVKKTAGLTNFTMHDLRRSFVANLITSGVPMPIASEAAGHSNLGSMGPYGRFAKGAVAKSLEQGAAGMQGRMAEAEAEKKLLTA
jgi:integrase